MGKKGLVLEIEKVSQTSNDLNALAKLPRTRRQWLVCGNIFFRHTKVFPCPKSKRALGMFELSSMGGPMEERDALSRLVTPWNSSYFPQSVNASPSIDVFSTNVVDCLFPETLEDTLDFEAIDEFAGETQQTIAAVLLQTKPQFLKKLMASLKERTKFKNLTPKKLLLLLQNADEVKKFTREDMRKVELAVLEQSGGKKLFATSVKDRQASVISLFFGGSGIVDKLEVTPPALCELCKVVLLSKEYPATAMKIALAELHFPQRKRRWVREAKAPLVFQINEKGKEVELFSYPEFDENRSQLEPKVTDAYHVLTNARKGATSGTYKDLCTPAAWQKVVQTDKALLTTSVVDDCIDKQNGDLARRVFSEEVQEAMGAVVTGDEHFKSAEFVYRFRRWFEACDKRGLSAEERVQRLVEMQEYLTRDISFETFPPQGTHIKGMPVVTFEAILANVATRIQLYDICQEKTYNQRAVSSLAVENFFSTLGSKAQHGCPRATDIPKLMSQIVEQNHFRHLDHEEVGFHNVASSSVYPVHKLDVCTTETSPTVAQEGLFKDHTFDFRDTCTKPRKAKLGKVTHDLKPLRGVQPIRSQFYKIDEQKLHTMRRMGIEDSDLQKFGIID